MISVNLPSQLPLFTLHHHVLLPGSTMSIPINNHNNASLLKTTLESRSLKSSIIGVVVVEDDPLISDLENPNGINSEDAQTHKHTSEQASKQTPKRTNNESLHKIGTAALVLESADWMKDETHVVLTGLCRFEVKELTRNTPFYVANVTQLDRFGESGEEEEEEDEKWRKMEGLFRKQTKLLVHLLNIPSHNLLKLKNMLDKIPIDQLTDVCAAIIKASFQERLSILDTVNKKIRLQKTLVLLQKQIEEVRLMRQKDQPFSRFDKQFAVQLRGHRLADDDDDDDDMDGFEEKIKQAGMPEEVERMLRREMRRMKKMTSISPEAAVIRNYVELMLQLPWNTSTKDTIDIRKARADLDLQHEGMKEVKERLVEFLAVQKIKNKMKNANKNINNIKNNNKDGERGKDNNNNAGDGSDSKVGDDSDCNVMKAPLLCLVGPPGVGKTSMARSVADTLGRKFYRISLGGISDQSDIRGHRRTYVGSMPGRIIEALKSSRAKNPVILLDEIDKMSRGVHGDPAAALLEVLDPEQNHAFVDHFVNVPFDLSQVLFIASANSLAPVAAALKDRMELIEIPAYTLDEKVHIASKHLLPKQASRHGIIINTHLVISADVIEFIISKYTREAGVRGLEKKLTSLLRAVALQVAQSGADDDDVAHQNKNNNNDFNNYEHIKNDTNNNNKINNNTNDNDAQIANANVNGEVSSKNGGDLKQRENVYKKHVEFAESMNSINIAIQNGRSHVASRHVLGGGRFKSGSVFPIVMDQPLVEAILGPVQYVSNGRDRLSSAGVSMGLAWTAYGGEVLYVEARKMKGRGRLVMTGQLGDVMKESASLALAWLNTHAQQLGISSYEPATTDFHIHFPAAAVSKDGPSAGITIATALVSLVTNRQARSDTAMTGELTLTGVVLQVGGVKEKVLAAHREGIRRVILPLSCQHQLRDLPPLILDNIEVILVKRMEEVLVEALTMTTTTTPSLLCKL